MNPYREPAPRPADDDTRTTPTPGVHPSRDPHVLAARAKAREKRHADLLPGPPPPTPTHALYWQGQMLRAHPSEGAAQADMKDCLKRRTADVKRQLPVGTMAGQVLPCSLCDGATDHTHAKHHDEHIGVFEVRPYVAPEQPQTPPLPTEE